MASLSQLAQNISNSVTALESALKDKGLSIPNLDETYNRNTEGLLFDPQVLSNINDVVAKVNMLLDTVSPPELNIYQMSINPFKTAALRTVMLSHIPELLREAGPQGMHIKDIAKETNLDEAKLGENSISKILSKIADSTSGRILRLLETSHVFRQTSPNVFVNNRLSSSLDTHMSIKLLRDDPASFAHTPDVSFPLKIQTACDNAAKAAAFLADGIVYEKEQPSGESVLYNYANTLAKDNARISRQGVITPDHYNYNGSQLFSKAVKALNLSDGSVIVGVSPYGTTTRLLIEVAEENPNLQFVLKLPPLEMFQYAKTILPPGIQNFTVEDTDILSESVKSDPSPSAFVMLWLDFYSHPHMHKILNNLHADATPGITRVFVTVGLLREGTNAIRRYYDLLKLAMHEGRETTHEYIDELMVQTGWKVERVHEEAGMGDLIQAVAM